MEREGYKKRIMKRIVKDPLERKNEIMDKALELFISQGYESTSINEIVSSLAIAKGTFYHYFISKEEILNELLKRELDSYIDPLIEIYNSDLKPHDKLEKFLRGMFMGRTANMRLGEIKNDTSNIKIQSYYEEEFFTRCYPLVYGIIKEGIDEGVLYVDFPEETVEILLRGIQKFMNKHYHQLSDRDKAIKLFGALEDIFNKLIHSNLGKIQLISRS